MYMNYRNAQNLKIGQGISIKTDYDCKNYKIMDMKTEQKRIDVLLDDGKWHHHTELRPCCEIIPSFDFKSFVEDNKKNGISVTWSHI